MSGLKIKQYREINKYSQRDLASILGVSMRSVARWEQNESKPHPDEMNKITKLLGITEDELLSEDDGDTESSAYKSKQDVLDRISDSVDNLVTGQETINESLSSNRDEYIRKQDEMIMELRSQNESLLSKIATYEGKIDKAKADQRHKRIIVIIVAVTCFAILALVLGTWLYLRNHGVKDRYLEGSAEKGTPSYFEIDDGQ